MKSLNKTRQPGRSPFMNEVIQLMKQNLHDEDFHLDRIWRELGMSRPQFYRKFHAIGGENPAALFYHLRLEKAKKLLLETDLNISEIAFRVGFCNASHFTRKFSHSFGWTPTAFRERG